MYYQVVMRRKVAGKVKEEVVVPELKSDAMSMLKLAQTLVRKFGKVEVSISRKKKLFGDYEFFQSMSRIF